MARRLTRITSSVCLRCRYSLSGIKPIPPPLISVDTSHSISSSAAESDCGLPAVYGVPSHSHSRPASRYSNRSHRSHRSARTHRSRSAHAAAANGHEVDRHGHLSLQPHSSSSAASTTHYSKYSNGRMIH